MNSIKIKISDYIPLILLAIFLIVYILPLGIMPLISPDETRYAEIPREMIASGNWVVPYLNGIPYFEKPVLGYWLTAVSELVFGYNNFAVRFPSAFCTGLSALMIYFFVKRFSDGKEIAGLACMVFLTGGLVMGIGSFAVLDAQTSFFLTGALIAFFYAYKSEKTSRQRLYLVFSGIFTGLAFLTKGFLAFAVIGLAAASFLVIERQWKKLFTMPWIPLLAAAVVILPWSVAIYRDEPDFWRYFFVVEHYQRFFTPGAKTQHPEAFWFFIPVLLWAILPWAIHYPSSVMGLFERKIFKSPFIRYLFCWLVFPFIFFSACSGKIESYILPCMPPLVILFAFGLYRYADGRRKCLILDITNTILYYLLPVALVGFIGYHLAAKIFTSIPMLYTSVIQIAGVFFAVVTWMAGLYLVIKSKDNMNKLFLFGMAPLIVFAVRFWHIPHYPMEGRAQGGFIMEQAEYISPDTEIIAHPNMMHALCWYLKRNDIYVYSGGGGEIEYNLMKPKYVNRYVDEEQDLRRFIAKPGRKDGLAYFIRGDFREDVPPSDIEAYKDGMMFSKFK